MSAALQKLRTSVGLGQQGEPESGRSVHRQYQKRLNDFYKLLDGGKLVETDLEGEGEGRGGDELGQLFCWAKKMVVDRVTLIQQLTEEQEHADGEARKIEQLLGQIEELQETVALCESKLESASRERHQMQADHDNQIGWITMEHSREMQAAEKKFQYEKQKLDSEKRHIQAQLLVSRDKSYAWPDEKLRVQFQELCRLLNNATAEIARSIDIPATGLGSRLDPDDTFSVAGSTGVHFWLRSRVWAVIEAGFFSQPYGFGAFGSDKGAREIMDVFDAWVSRLHSPADSGRPV